MKIQICAAHGPGKEYEFYLLNVSFLFCGDDGILMRHTKPILYRNGLFTIQFSTARLRRNHTYCSNEKVDPNK